MKKKMLNKLEIELKSMFRPNLKIENKVTNKKELKNNKEIKSKLQQEMTKAKLVAANQHKSKGMKNKGVYERMQKDLEERKVRNKNRMMLK